MAKKNIDCKAIAIMRESARILISCFVIVGGCVLMVVSEDAVMKTWAGGIIGTTIGYWIR